MSNAVQRFLEALRGHGCEPRKAGDGWACRCPAHDDRNPSLSIHAGDDGGVVWRCHAGCDQPAVIAALGLTFRDLMPEDPSRRNGHAAKSRRRGDGDTTPRKPARGDSFVAVASDATGGRTFTTAPDAVAELERRHGPRSATWTYANAAGDPVGLVVRWNTPTGKDVRPVSRKADGLGWIIGGMPTPRPLYGLPDLVGTKPGERVYVVEGEKAADACRACGLTATTSPHGSKSAAKADWSPVAGREVVILPDFDGAGETYADDVARLVTAAGAKAVRVVRLVDLWAGMPKGGDMADLVEHRGGDVEPIRAEVEALADKAEPEAVESIDDAPARDVFKPFPVDVLPEPVRALVVEGAKAIGCDASFIALPLLSSAAAAIGTTYRVELKPGWTEPAIVWTAIVGLSGTMKTPAFKLAMKALRKAQAKAFKEYEAARPGWEAEHLRYEAELAAWKRQAAKGHGDAGDPPTKPDALIARRYIVSDTTTEALAPMLRDNPRGVLLARDELAGWLGSFDRYAKSGKGGGDSAHWLSMHSGDAMTIDRKTGIPPTIHVPSAAVSITGGIQPGTLRRALGQEHHESGMAARILFAMPPRKPKRWTEASVSASTESAVTAVFDGLLSLRADVDDEGDERPWILPLTESAKAAWRAFYDEHAREQMGLDEDLSAAWSKLEACAVRLTMLVHLMRWAGGDPVVPVSTTPVDAVSMAAGVALAQWFGDEAKRVYAILSESEDDAETRRLVEWIESKGGTVTARDLTRGPREYRDADKAAKALADLVAQGCAVRIPDDHGPKGGRPADRVRLVSRGGDTGDGDETRANTGNGASCVAVANPASAGDGWGEV
jgi:hypothetical protein